MVGPSQDQIDDILFAARSGDVQAVEQFFKDHGVESFITVKNEFSQSTPLHMAAANGHLEVVQLILKYTNGAKDVVNAQNDYGNTALHWAALGDNLDVVKALCDANADPFIKNSAGHDAFYEAEVNAPELEDAEEGAESQQAEQQPQTAIDYLLQRYNVEPADDGADEVAALSVKDDESKASSSSN